MEAQAAQRTGHVQALAKVKFGGSCPRMGEGWGRGVFLAGRTMFFWDAVWPRGSGLTSLSLELAPLLKREDKSSDHQSVRLEGGAGAQEPLQDLAHSRRSGNEFPIFPEPPLPCPWPWGVTGLGWASGRRGLGRLGP